MCMAIRGEQPSDFGTLKTDYFSNTSSHSTLLEGACFSQSFQIHLFLGQSYEGPSQSLNLEGRNSGPACAGFMRGKR